MQKRITILMMVLAVQLLLAAILLNKRDDYGAFQTQEHLLDIDKSKIDVLFIESADKSSLRIERKDGKWILPASQGFPASPDKLDALLDKLLTLKPSWPVATSASAASRFKVSDDEFERRISLLAGEQTLAKLYLGSSPGFRKIHARVDGKDAIYSVAFSAFEAETKSDDWLNRAYLKLARNDLASISLNGMTLENQDGNWGLAGLAEGESVKQGELDALLGRLVDISFSSLAETGAETSVGEGAAKDAQADFSFSVNYKDGKQLEYSFFKDKEGEDYSLRRSGDPFVLKLTKFVVEPLKEASRDKLLQVAKAEPVAAEAAPGETETGESGATGSAPAESAPPAPVTSEPATGEQAVVPQ